MEAMSLRIVCDLEYAFKDFRDCGCGRDGSVVFKDVVVLVRLGYDCDMRCFS